MKKIQSFLRITVFLVLLVFLLGGLSNLMEQKDSTIGIKPFLDHAKDHDILFLGDSQMLNSVMPWELYHRYGLTSYNLASSNCHIPMTYWKMMNAFDYMTPKLVVLAIMGCNVPELTSQSEWLHVAFDGFPLTLTKAKAILELTDQEGELQSGVSFSDVRQELFFPLRKYHSRWSSLTAEDLKPAYNTQKGFDTLVPVSDPTVESKHVAPDIYDPETGYGYAYIRRIIEECQSRNIPIILLQPPYPIREDNHRSVHTCERIAAEYGIPMLNFVDTNRIADFYIDCADPACHINVSGARKMTDYIGDYLTNHYELPDRRNDPAYAHWEDGWNAYVDEKIRIIAEDADSLRSRLMLLHDESFSLVLTVRPGFDYDSRNTKIALQNIARQHVYEGDDLVSSELKPLDGLSDAADFNKGYMIIVDRDAGDEYEAVQEFYGIGEQEFETSFGYVFCRMDGEWIDLSITQDDTETYYFDNWDDQEQDMRLILIDRRTGKPALTMAFSRTEEELH